jgi:hypothetical protein
MLSLQLAGHAVDAAGALHAYPPESYSAQPVHRSGCFFWWEFVAQWLSLP